MKTVSSEHAHYRALGNTISEPVQNEFPRNRGHSLFGAAFKMLPIHVYRNSPNNPYVPNANFSSGKMTKEHYSRRILTTPKIKQLAKPHMFWTISVPKHPSKCTSFKYTKYDTVSALGAFYIYLFLLCLLHCGYWNRIYN